MDWKHIPRAGLAYSLSLITLVAPFAAPLSARSQPIVPVSPGSAATSAFSSTTARNIYAAPNLMAERARPLASAAMVAMEATVETAGL